ncbi:hypothetical protein IE53DRAFT_385556 [Violaceomyces palustris]|uniref:Uncharacterized protein n=1 Tax=Violaceomyces palustris TaxID=1673888 RepID=A0ACD0P289_9BASI|nr:hypothetical protein IE53DRAFT_385556 [Violaceomyces palustris]
MEITQSTLDTFRGVLTALALVPVYLMIKAYIDKKQDQGQRGSRIERVDEVRGSPSSSAGPTK